MKISTVKSVEAAPDTGTSDPIPLYVPSLRDEELANLTECVRSNLLIHGPFVGKFERQLADFVGTRHGIGTSSGTSALHTALLLAGVRPDDEVLITTLTFVAPANAITYVNAHPVFIDVEPATWQMDTSIAVRFLTEQCQFDGHKLVNKSTGRRIGAIIAVHFLGMPVDLNQILPLAEKYNIPVIEDAAQALGTEYSGKRVGSMGLLGCFSFHGNKLITAGGGGMIVTNDTALAKRARYLVNQAKDDPVETSHNAIGFNYRMTNIHGAIGCAQFNRIEDHIRAKRGTAGRYARGLQDIPGIALVKEAPGTFYTYWLSTITVDPGTFGMTARQLLASLRASNIESLPLYQPLHTSLAHKGSQSCGGAVAERLTANALSLPSSVDLSEDNQLRVIDAIRAAHRSGK